MIGIICAEPEEIETIVSYMVNIKKDKIHSFEFIKGKLENSECVLALSGVGKVNAAICAQTLILKYNPKFILNIGVAGGIDNNLKIGDIVIGENATLLSMNIIVPQTIVFAGCFDNLSLSNIAKNKIQNNNITGVYVNLDITKYIKMISDKDIHNVAYLYTKNSEMSANISKYISRYCSNENIAYHPLIIDGNLDSNDIENIIKSKNIDYLILANEDYINNNIKQAYPTSFIRYI